MRRQPAEANAQSRANRRSRRSAKDRADRPQHYGGGYGRDRNCLVQNSCLSGSIIWIACRRDYSGTECRRARVEIQIDGKTIVSRANPICVEPAGTGIDYRHV